MPLTVTSVTMLAAVFVVKAQSTTNENGVCDARSCQYEVSCSFNDGICPGWENVKENDNFDWKRHSSCQFNSDRGCVTVNFNGQPANTFARLQSPCICATGRNGSSLTFRYAIAGGQNSQNCPLTVFTTTMKGDVLFWTSSGATATRFRGVSETITHNVSPFKITFQAKKTNRNPCGVNFNEINLADFIYKGVAPPTTTSTTTTLTTTKESETTTNATFIPLINDGSGLISDTNPGGESLGDGAMGGIVIGVLVVVGLTLIVVAAIWRRRRTEQGKKPSRLGDKDTELEKKEGLQTIVNPGYMHDEDNMWENGEVVVINSFYGTANFPESPPYSSAEPDEAASASNFGTITKNGANRSVDTSISGSTETYSTTVSVPGKRSNTPKESEPDLYSKPSPKTPRGARANVQQPDDHQAGLDQRLNKNLTTQSSSNTDDHQLSAHSGRPKADYANLNKVHPEYMNLAASRPTGQHSGESVYNKLNRDAKSRTDGGNASGEDFTGAEYNHLNEFTADASDASGDQPQALTSRHAVPKEDEDTQVYMNVGRDGV